MPVPVDHRALQAYDPAAYGAPQAGPAEGGGFNIARANAALRRFSWLIAGTGIVGLGAGIVATRFIDPQYVVNATVFATPTSQTGGGRGGPISDGALTQNAGWRDLLQSFAIADPVVVKLSLYLRPDKAADSIVFANFGWNRSRGFVPGEYTLKTEGGRYSLTDKIGFIHEQGLVGDSIGRTAGFAWQPPARLLGVRSRTIGFKVVTPREASLDLITKRLSVGVSDKSPVIQLVLKGTAAQRPAATLNAMLTQFVDVASELKKRELVQHATTLGTQLEAAQARLTSAERALESYRIATISKPSEANSVAIPSMAGGAGGVEITTPVFNTYFARKYELETLQRDRATLEKLAAALRVPSPSVTPDAILSVPTVSQDPGAEGLRTVVKELDDQQGKLRQLRMVVTDSNPDVKTARRLIAEAHTNSLLPRLNDYIGSLRSREKDLQQQVAQATTELQEIPSRTIQQGALERERVVAAELYTRLRAAYAGANLAQQSAIPDVKVLDSAVTPLEPSSNTAPKIIGAALVGGLGLGLALALLLDLMDSRFRYPEQARHELGLEVLGVVPVVDQSGRQSPEAVAQIVEAFRSIRMSVRYASGGQRSIALGITSPGPGDGKSLIASNLALSFAEGGWRTVLIDADIRRGQLNATFDVPTVPGLVEYLEGTSLLGEVLHPTRHDNLTVLPSGTRHNRAPELLATPRLQQLLATLSGEFDVIIMDTPPLGAGTDAYAVGTACGQLAIVLRNSRTNLKMAKAKLAVVAQLPVTVLGAILNEVHTDSTMYQYYSYDPDYVLAEETPSLTAGGGTAVATREG